MTNLQAMQDERLQDLIHQVEQLERLQDSISGTIFPERDSSKEIWAAHKKEMKQRRILQDDLNRARDAVKFRWKELMEE